MLNLNPWRKYQTLKQFLAQLSSIPLIQNAICDPKGLSGFNLKLHNAHIQKHHCDIFYNLYYKASKGVFGGGATTNTRSLNSLDSDTNSHVKSHKPVCIDCGVHAGLISDILLECGSIVYAFEPNKILHSFLESKYQNNPNIILHQAAVSDKNGTTTFLLSDSTSQGNRISESGDNDSIYDDGSYEVQVIDLVEYINTHILTKFDRIYFLKLDIEGAEFDIMDKIMEYKLYEKIDFIACETHERYFTDGEAKIKKLRKLVKQANAKNILLDWI